ncbi:MAG TPA: FHA domain-containing protein, partial [Candidatus Dormibacteraeota bacterium]|nr:FHA domain-containing protein [Candidatus Dormibacteraeota bacterium]
APPPAAPAPAWGPPATSPIWSAPSPAEQEAPKPSPTDEDLASGANAEAPVEAPVATPGPPPWEAPAAAGSDVAETMVQRPSGMEAESAENRESTTLMPAWQPPPAPPAAVAETMAIGTHPAPVAMPGTGPQAELSIESGPDAGHSHRASDHAVRLGRSPDNDVILRDPATSGHHARLERRGDQYWIVDLGSTNGTLVNGEPIQEKQLNHGDRVTIGQNAVQFAILGA